jgi:tetratricopeptide (TPR) repeat protein
MDDQQFLKACQLRDDGKLTEAIDEFRRIAEDTRDPVDRAGVLLNVAATLRALSEFTKAREELRAARSLAASSDASSAQALRDPRLLQLEVSLDFEEADICGYEGKLDEALTKFDLLLKKYGQTLKEPELRESYEMIQARRGFLFADLGRCKEALPVLEEAESFEERKAEIYFYLGHCYLTDCEYARAAGKLVNALRLRLPRSLEYRAHCELGIAYYRLKDYAQAKLEFEKSAETADAEYIQESQIWKWLEDTSRTLGLKDQADRYSKLAMSSKQGPDR